MAVLRISRRDGSTVHELSSKIVTIGRDPSNTIALDDMAASSTHAEITTAGRGWRLVDRNSTNGTFVNGHQIQSKELVSGDEIRIGKTSIEFDEGGASESKSSGRFGHNREFLESMIVDSGPVQDEDSSAPLPSLLIDHEPSRSESDSASDYLPIDSGSSQGRDQTMVLESQARPEDHAGEAEFIRRPGESLESVKLRLIQRVSEKLVRIFEPKELTSEIMSIVTQQTKADRGLLCLLDEDGHPQPIAAVGYGGNDSVRVSRTVLGRLLDERKGVLITRSPAADAELISLEEMQVFSTMCVPLWTGDKIIGLLSLDTTTPEMAFSHDDLELLLAVAHQAAVGIERGRLNQQVDAERRARDYMSKYLDERLVQQIRSGDDSEDPLAPKEREVTVLFSDIVSFTKLSEPMAPTELARFVREYLTAMTDIIFNFGGTVDKYIGDAVMALFGAPVASDDAAASAIQAALEMRLRTQEFRLSGDQERPLRIRVGINTGRVVVGNLGSVRRMEYTALGDTVNVASRLETFARPNEICLDERTYQQAKDAFEFEDIGTIDVKNRADPVVVYKVLRAQLGSL